LHAQLYSHTLKNVGQIWTNPNVGLKMQLKNVKLKFEVGLKFYITFVIQHLVKTQHYLKCSKHSKVFQGHVKILLPKLEMKLKNAPFYNKLYC